MTSFAEWLDDFVDEKGLDPDHIFTVETPGNFWQSHLIPLEVVIAATKTVSTNEQAIIKATLVKLDWFNRPVLRYFEHLAKALAEALNDLGHDARTDRN